MRKIAAFVAVLALGIVAVGCSEKTEATKEEEQAFRNMGNIKEPPPEAVAGEGVGPGQVDGQIGLGAGQRQIEGRRELPKIVGVGDAVVEGHVEVGRRFAEGIIACAVD